jgi:formylmethanofuran dehydrogenase subunit C
MGLVMVVVMGVAGLSIDAATWDVKHHQDQVVADSAALAAANCLANPNTGQNTASVPQCTSSTDTADAQKVAVAYAAQNGLTITTGQVSVSGSTVTVNAQSTTPSYFAKVAHVGNVSESANASAGFMTASTGASTLSWGCTTAQQNSSGCDAIYAADTSCGSSNGWTAYSTSIAVNGTVDSQGAINLTNGSYALNGAATYSNACTYSGSASPAPTAVADPTHATWPADFSKVFTSCGSGYSYQCTGPGGTPSYCTYAAASYNVTGLSNGVYCVYGTGTPSTPSSWNGNITITNGASFSASVTLIAGSIQATGIAMTLTPYSNFCTMYALDTNSTAGGSNSNSPIYLQNGTYSTAGGTFAPNGTITVQGTAISSGFLEALDVLTYNGSFSITGTGPSSSSGATVTTSSTAGSDSLTQ